MIYLDNAATTFIKPKTVYKEVRKCLKKYCGNSGRGGHSLSMTAGEIVYRCREEIAKLFNIYNPLSISFSLNATQSLNMGIKGFLKENDHVLISPFEHNSVVRPLNKLKDINVSYTVLPINENLDVIDIEKNITENTKMIIINHGSNVCGKIQDIKKIGEIAKKKGIIFLVDASQTAGLIDIDVQEMNIDILCCSGHKGLYGLQGTGVLYIKPSLKLSTIIEGGTGSFSEDEQQPIIIPDRFESGTLNLPGISGLLKGVEFINKTRPINIYNHEKKLVDYLISELKNIKQITIYGDLNERRTSTVAFNIRGIDSVLACDILSEKYNIMLRGGYHCSFLAHKTLGTLDVGVIRASVSYFNSIKDIKFLISAVKNLII